MRVKPRREIHLTRELPVVGSIVLSRPRLFVEFAIGLYKVFKTINKLSVGSSTAFHSALLVVK